MDSVEKTIEYLERLVAAKSDFEEASNNIGPDTSVPDAEEIGYGHGQASVAERVLGVIRELCERVLDLEDSLNNKKEEIIDLELEVAGLIAEINAIENYL